MARNSRSRQATSPREGHVRATVHVEGDGLFRLGSLDFGILSVLEILRQSSGTAARESNSAVPFPGSVTNASKSILSCCRCNDDI
jgi:hypothetical protein